GRGSIRRCWRTRCTTTHSTSRITGSGQRWRWLSSCSSSPSLLTTFARWRRTGRCEDDDDDPSHGASPGKTAPREVLQTADVEPDRLGHRDRHRDPVDPADVRAVHLLLPPRGGREDLRLVDLL